VDCDPPVAGRLRIAKREETRERRLSQLIADSEAGRRIPQLARPDKKKPSRPKRS
jgi:hypothetical protein